MSLDAYRRHRLIVQNASTSALKAARAMNANDVGAILVTEDSAIVGIVTDRDLALRVVGRGRDPRTTTLKDVMSPRVATLPPDASVADALRVMRERRVRRVPVVERGRVAGMATLDDLILERAATLDALAGVVRAQLHVGGPTPTRPYDEWRALERRYARALQTWGRVVARVQAATELATRERTERAIEIVVDALVQRLDPPVAKRLIARLPALVQGRLRALPHGPDDDITRATLERRLAEALSVHLSSAASIARAVGDALAPSFEPGGAILRRLPDDLRSLLGDRASRSGRRPARRPASRPAT